MVSDMKFMEIIYRIDQFILELLKDFNEGIVDLKKDLINFLIPMSFLWGFFVVLYQIFEYLRLAVWKQMSPYTQGFSINSSFIGFDKIVNFLIDLHPFFSLPLICICGIYFLYFLLKIIFFVLKGFYILIKGFLFFWSEDHKL
jgi:hypothetical protein